MIFLDGAATTAEIKRLTDSSKKVRMAVAFWGDGATDGLGLEAKGQSATIICNLKSGGTNPHEIQKLINNKVFVLQCDTLHGKVYLFDDHVILGSSNASANGLALQGKELSGWHEANILTSERVILRDAEQWINRLETRVVSPIDMEEAKLAFSKRRAAASVVAPAVVPLVDALKAHPESFKDRRIFVCAYLSRFEQADIDRVEKEQAKHGGGHTVDAVGWRVPTDARLLLFYINSRGKVTYDGFWERPKTEWKSGGRSPIYFMSKIKNIDGSSAIGIGEAWEPALLAFRDAEISGSDSEAKHIELGDFYERYLLHTKTKILNVRDGFERLKPLGNDEYESGFWFRPVRGCEIIRVYKDDGGVSFRGGKIHGVRDEIRKGRNTKVFMFRDDPMQHGKARPKFQQNGCAATLE